MEDDRKLIVVDENGKELEMEVLFTFEADEEDPKFKGNKYILYFNPQDEEPQVYASKYDNEGNLYPIDEDSKDEWDMIEEVYNTFIDDEEEEA